MHTDEKKETENLIAIKSDIYLLSIIGEVEGHEALAERAKATKYEHILPNLAKVEDDAEIKGVLILLNTVGGDVEAGLAIAEMIASMSKPTVSLVLGGGHSIGVPLAVSADYSFIVPSATMVIHPVRQSGIFIPSCRKASGFFSDKSACKTGGSADFISCVGSGSLSGPPAITKSGISV